MQRLLKYMNIIASFLFYIERMAILVLLPTSNYHNDADIS